MFSVSVEFNILNLLAFCYECAEANKGQSQNIFFNPKKIFHIAMFLENHFQTIYHFKKTVADLNNTIGSTKLLNNFYKSETSLKIQELLWNPEKYLSTGWWFCPLLPNLLQHLHVSLKQNVVLNNYSTTRF